MNTQPHARRLTALAALATIASLASGPTLAQDTGYTYGGISAGASRGKFDDAGITARQLAGNPTAVTLTGSTRDDQDNAYRLFLGYQFNRYVGVEAAFFNLGKFHYQSTTSPSGQLNGELKVQGGGLDVVGALPIGESFALLGRIGGQYAKTRGQFNGSGAVVVGNPAPSDRQFNYKAGVGLQYTFNPNFLMRLEGDQYRVRDTKDGNGRVQVLTVSAVFPFGAGASQSRPRAQAAYQPLAYVAPAPVVVPAPMADTPPVAPMEPMAVVTPKALPPMPQRVSFSAESLFGFDKSEIRPEGKAALDAFALELAGTQFDMVMVEGHADRTGTTAYNQTLSLQRAEAVKAYLVTAGGIDASKVNATGKGETAPTTQPGDCKASLPTAQLRSCLQPDRRVDIEVQGRR